MFGFYEKSLFCAIFEQSKSSFAGNLFSDEKSLVVIFKRIQNNRQNQLQNYLLLFHCSILLSLGQETYYKATNRLWKLLQLS